MSMNRKIQNLKQSKMIVNLKKYSNVALFSRREEERLKRSNSSIKTLKDYIYENNNSNYNKKSSKLTTPTDDLSTYALKTISSFKNTFDSFSTKVIFSNNTLLNETNKNDKTINPYFTISSFRSENKNNFNNSKNNKDRKKYKRNLFCLTQNNFKDNSSIKKKHFNTINFQSHKNNFVLKEKENEIKLLRQINFRQYKESLNQNEKYLLNTKLKKMDSDKYNISLMLNRVREIKYYNYLNEQKKEINKTSLENTKNHIDFLSDKIKSLNNLHIYDNQMSNKLGEYSKFITNYKEREKINSDILLNQINKLKKEVKNLQNKIAKKEIEKASILKWVYFFIKMKEKKLVLPLYYKKIIEMNFSRKKEKRRTILVQLENIKLIQDSHKYFLFHDEKKQGKDNSNKMLSHIRFNTYDNVKRSETSENSDNTNKLKKIGSKKSNKKIRLLTKSTISFKKNSLQLNYMKTNDLKIENIINFEDDEMDKKLKKDFDKLVQEGIDIDEINRISKYKMFLIYNTPEDLQDRLVELQNENVQLLKQYQNTRKKLLAKKFKYEEIMENIIEDALYDLNKRIKEKEIFLNQEKKKNELLMKQLSEDKKKLKGKIVVINIKQKKGASKKNKLITLDYVRKELFSKIDKLYKLCAANIEDSNNYIFITNHKNKADVIFKLKIIEYFIVNLKSKLNFNDKSDIIKYDLMRRIKNDIEHKHKIEKGQILRMQEKEKFKNFQEEIEEKINKISFLPKRKLIPVYNLENINKEKHIIHEKKLNFEDFMFNEN